MEKSRRHGPDPKPSHELRRHSVSCRLTDAELAQLDKLRGEVSRGEWLRVSAMSKPPRIVPTVNKVAWSDLSRVAGNLNQLNRAINEGKFPVSNMANAGRVIIELRAQVDLLRRQLLGVENSDES